MSGACVCLDAMRTRTYRTTVAALAIAALLTVSGSLGTGCGDGGGGDNDNNAPATCGNGTVDTGERCDDGNRQNGDGCASNCLEECGNTVCTVGQFCCNNDAGSVCFDLGSPCVP